MDNGSFPAELQQDLVFTAAVAADTKDAPAAKAFIDFLQTPEAAAVLKAKGGAANLDRSGHRTDLPRHSRRLRL